MTSLHHLTRLPLRRCATWRERHAAMIAQARELAEFAAQQECFRKAVQRYAPALVPLIAPASRNFRRPK
jgi:hypothetical protein